jgi:heme/copper-type cytochrome/quinol oxidase subunit 2
LLIWVLGFGYFLFTSPIEPTPVFVDGQNTPDQGYISKEQFRNLEFILWVTLPITYGVFELLIWLLITDKTNWHLETYPKIAFNVLWHHKLIILAMVLLFYSAYFFIYGVLVGLITFPLIMVGAWKF